MHPASPRMAGIQFVGGEFCTCQSNPCVRDGNYIAQLDKWGERDWASRWKCVVGFGFVEIRLGAETIVNLEVMLAQSGWILVLFADVLCFLISYIFGKNS